MKQLELDNVKRWSAVGSSELPHPISINSLCPACSHEVLYTTRRRLYDAQRDTLACSADCPSCNAEAHFWITDLTTHADALSGTAPSLFMLPAATSRMDLSKLAGLLPENVWQFCMSTQDVYASGNLTATRIMVQSTLDAIFGNFLPSGNSRTTLAKLIQDSIPSIDLDRPLMTLASSIRPGEHLDTLFKDGEPLNREAADTLMSLVEKLITFLYILPAEFAELDQHLASLSRQATVAADPPDKPDDDSIR